VYEQTVDAVLEVLGEFRARSGATLNGVLNVGGQIAALYAAPRISNTGYADGQIQILQTTPSEPRIGFHEGGSTALALYKQAGADRLRVREHTGTDWEVAGAPGSITTDQLAAGAAQAQIGSYATAPTYSTTSIATWVATTVTTGSIACTGAPCRIECSTQMYHSVAGGGFYTGLMLDGGVLVGMSYQICPASNYSLPISWVFYYTPSATSHTFTLCVNKDAAGTLTINPAAISCLYVTEQRR
jgi:hypothetical protein